MSNLTSNFDTERSSKHNKSLWHNLKETAASQTSDFLGISQQCDPLADFSFRRLRLASRRCGELKYQIPPLETFSDVVDAVTALEKSDESDFGVVQRTGSQPSNKTRLKQKLSCGLPSLTHNLQECYDPTRCKADSKLRKSTDKDTNQDEDDLDALVVRLSKRKSVAHMFCDAMGYICFKCFDQIKPTQKPTCHHLGAAVDNVTLISRRNMAEPTNQEFVDTGPYIEGAWNKSKMTTSYVSDDVFVTKEASPLPGSVGHSDEQTSKTSLIKPKEDTVFRTTPLTRQSKQLLTLHPITKRDTKELTQFSSHEGSKDTAWERFNDWRTRLISRLLRRPSIESGKRYIGQGMMMDILHDPGYNDRVWNRPDIIFQIRNLEDYRPYFTYWITFIQIVVLIAALFIYGVGPLGFGLRQQQKVLLKTSLSLEKAGFLEPENFWIGPNAFALIHLGAKYPPCMHGDPVIALEIENERRAENLTSCCIRRDGAGCIQSTWYECQDKSFYHWISAADVNANKAFLAIDNYTVGTVCGLDPSYCANPLATALRPWPNDLTFWPICKKYKDLQLSANGVSSSSSNHYAMPSLPAAAHMTCDIIGKPCCIGIRGSCIITTQEYCTFVRGHFHEEAHLCSQVECMLDICGMLPFATTSTAVYKTAKATYGKTSHVPDQIYRLWVSLFLHAGILPLIVTVLFQFTIMRDLEKLSGPLRIGIIYFVSGIGGNLGSAMLLADRADSGPSGAQFGILACLFVELFQNWQILKAPTLALIKMSLLYAVLILFGFLPWIDNFSHMFGFYFGFLLSFSLVPYLTFGAFDRKRKLLTLIASAITVILTYTAMLVIFYLFPQLSYACKFCKYLDCVPLEKDFCNNHQIRINQ